MHKIKIALLLLAGILIGLAGGLYGSRWVLPLYPKLVCGNDCQNAITPDHRFFSDELLLLGETEQGSPFLLYLDLNRKRIANQYSHYYYADFVYQNQHRQLYTDFTAANEAVSSHSFLTDFSSGLADDLSAREHYDLEFTANNLVVKASLQDLKGDFIVKNTLDYTKYVSEGDSQVTINGTTYTMHAYLAKIYTPYYDKYVFFNGYDTLRSLAQYFVLWDELGDMYVIDHSDVFSQQADYKPHTWVLYKDKAGQYMKKAFSGTVQAETDGSIPKKWSLNIPDLKTTLELSPTLFITSRRNNGLVTGTVTTPWGVQNVKGFFTYQKYGN